MPRRDTPLTAGNFYHLYNRGHNRSPIFFEPENYAFFLGRIRKYLVPTHVIVVAYMLMPNHYHLLVRTLTDHLSRGMQRLSISYTKAVNVRYDRTGSLFEGAFQARFVEDNSYVLELSR